jgi:hypothetical protein
MLIASPFRRDLKDSGYRSARPRRVQRSRCAGSQPLSPTRGRRQMRTLEGQHFKHLPTPDNPDRVPEGELRSRRAVHLGKV